MRFQVDRSLFSAAATLPFGGMKQLFQRRPSLLEILQFTVYLYTRTTVVAYNTPALSVIRRLLMSLRVSTIAAYLYVKLGNPNHVRLSI